MERFRWTVFSFCLLALASCTGAGRMPAREEDATRSALAAPSPQETSAFTAKLTLPRWRDLAYVPGGGTNQRLDVYLPSLGEGPFPVVLAFHGGGFRARDKAEQTSLAQAFTEMGYAFIPANYRLTPGSSYPAQVEDVFCALAWIHANHEAHGLDSEEVIVMGESAGGYLAAMVATVDNPSDYLGGCPNTLPAADWVQAAIIFYGLFDFTSIDGYPPKDLELRLEPYWGAEHQDIPLETLAEMSPISWVDGSEPPILLIHGTSDEAVPSWMSEEFAATLEAAGVDVELLLLDAGHAFTIQPLTNPVNVQALQAAGAFLAAITE